MSAPVPLDPATVRAGDSFGPWIVTPTEVQLFRFSAVTWNAHRIHYDLPHARAEGYPGILVQSHLHGCFLAQAVLAWGGPGSRLLRFSWQNRGVAVPGDELACTGTVTGVTGSTAACGSPGSLRSAIRTAACARRARRYWRWTMDSDRTGNATLLDRIAGFAASFRLADAAR